MSCIYCGTKIDLADSDIIPDALTNAKIINPHVCRVAHNNRFSDMFENEIINDMALITNELDIKSSKGKKYAVYDAKVVVGGTEYKTKLSSDTELFKGSKFMVTEDGKTKLGPLEQVMKIKNATEENVQVVDVNHIEIEKRVIIKTETYFSLAMYRLMTKIAFEWYCLHNGIEDKNDKFEDIINFIVKGEGNNPVTIVGNETVYGLFDQYTNFANHTLLCYIASDNSVNILISLFGIAIYNVRILNEVIEECSCNALFQTLTIDAKREQFYFKNKEELNDDLINSFYNMDFGNGMTVLMPKDMTDMSLQYQMLYLQNYDLFATNLMCVDKPDSVIVHMIIKHIEKLLQESALTIRGLKRFVNEHKEYLERENALNPNGTNKQSIFMFFILYTIGNSNGKISSMKELISYLKQRFSGTEISISDDMSKNLYTEIFKDKDYFEKIKMGALVVDKWEFE